jgi:hypothetical protein
METSSTVLPSLAELARQLVEIKQDNWIRRLNPSEIARIIFQYRNHSAVVHDEHGKLRGFVLVGPYNDDDSRFHVAFCAISDPSCVDKLCEMLKSKYPLVEEFTFIGSTINNEKLDKLPKYLASFYTSQG